MATVAEFTTATIAELGRLSVVLPTHRLAADLGLDEMDVVDLVITAEEELEIFLTAEDEESLKKPETTVQDVIDLFTKRKQEQ